MLEAQFLDGLLNTWWHVSCRAMRVKDFQFVSSQVKTFPCRGPHPLTWVACGLLLHNHTAGKSMRCGLQVLALSSAVLLAAVGVWQSLHFSGPHHSEKGAPWGWGEMTPTVLRENILSNANCSCVLSLGDALQGGSLAFDGTVRMVACVAGWCCPTTFNVVMVWGGVSYAGTITEDSDVQVQAFCSFGMEKWTTWAFWYFFQCSVHLREHGAHHPIPSSRARNCPQTFIQKKVLSTLIVRANIAVIAYYIVKKLGLHATPQATRLYQTAFVLGGCFPMQQTSKQFPASQSSPPASPWTTHLLWSLPHEKKSCIYCGRGTCHVEVREHMCGVGALPSPLWVPGIELRPQAASTFILWAILLAYSKYFLEVFNSYPLHYSAHLSAPTSHLNDGDRHLAGHPTLIFAPLAHFSQDNQKDHLTGRIYFPSKDLISPPTLTLLKKTSWCHPLSAQTPIICPSGPKLLLP